MKIFIKMGLRNLFRNKRRSILTSIIIGLGLAAIIITDGFYLGMSENMVRTITNSLIAEGQIQHPQFKDSFKVEYQILNLPRVREILNSNDQVVAFSERTVSFAMISAPKGMKNVTLYGVDPAETQVSTLHKQIVAGEFVKDENSLVIGSILQKRLEVDLGDKIVVTAAKQNSGEISQELFRITGIMRAGSKEMDEKTAFIHKKRAQKLLDIGTGVHQIAIKFHNRQIAQQPEFLLWTELKETKNLAESWLLVVSSFVGLMEMVDQSKIIIGAIMMFLVAVGVINTLFMALYERMFEFAVLRALGTKSKEIVCMIVSEASYLSIISIGTGFVIVLGVSIPMRLWGLDYGGMEFAEVTFREPIYFVFAWHQFLVYPIIAIIFIVLISLYPATYATRINMAQAIKRSL